MTRSHFKNPHGLPEPEQHTTARDMAILAGDLRDFPERAEMFSTMNFVIHRGTFHSQNDLLRTLDGADGMKTGFTCGAGYNVVAAATRDGRRMIAVVLGEAMREERSLRAAALLEHGFRTAEWKRRSGREARAARDGAGRRAAGARHEQGDDDAAVRQFAGCGGGRGAGGATGACHGIVTGGYGGAGGGAGERAPASTAHGAPSVGVAKQGVVGLRSGAFTYVPRRRHCRHADAAEGAGLRARSSPSGRPWSMARMAPRADPEIMLLASSTVPALASAVTAMPMPQLRIDVAGGGDVAAEAAPANVQAGGRRAFDSVAGEAGVGFDGDAVAARVGRAFVERRGCG